MTRTEWGRNITNIIPQRIHWTRSWITPELNSNTHAANSNKSSRLLFPMRVCNVSFDWSLHSSHKHKLHKLKGIAKKNKSIEYLFVGGLALHAFALFRQRRTTKTRKSSGHFCHFIRLTPYQRKRCGEKMASWHSKVMIYAKGSDIRCSSVTAVKLKLRWLRSRGSNLMQNDKIISKRKWIDSLLKRHNYLLALEKNKRSCWQASCVIFGLFPQVNKSQNKFSVK